jgi:hypothetical protein
MMFIPPNLGKFDITNIDYENNRICILAESKKGEHRDHFSTGGDKCYYTFPFSYFWGKDWKRNLRLVGSWEKKGKIEKIREVFGVDSVKGLESVYTVAAIAGLRNKKS